jgi:hypothetical protein
MYVPLKFAMSRKTVSYCTVHIQNLVDNGIKRFQMIKIKWENK